MASWADAFAGGGSAAPAKGTKAPAAAASGGWGDAFAGGGSTSSGGAKDPVAIAQQSLNKTAADVGYAGAFTGAAQHARDVAAGNVKPHQNILQIGMSGLGWLGSDVRATLRQYEHLATGHGMSEAQAERDTKNRIGAGQLIESGLNHGKPVHGLQRVLQDVGGFVGDVATDPLTYVGGMGSGAAGEASANAAGHVAEAVGAKEVAAQSAAEADRIGGLAAKAAHSATNATEGAAASSSSAAESLAAQHSAAVQTALEHADAAAKLDPEGVLTHDTALRLQKGGVAALTAQEKAALGVKSGIGLHVPGTRLAASAGLIEDPAMVRLLPSALTDPIQESLHGGLEALKGTGPMQSLAEKFSKVAPLRQEIRAAAAEGDGEKINNLVSGLRATNVERGAKQAFGQEWGAKAAEAWAGIPAWAHEDVVSAVEGDAGAAARLKEVGLAHEPVAQFFKDIKGAAKEKGVDLGNIDQYFPHQLTEEAQAAAASANPTRGRRVFEGLLQRTYSKGDPFLGEELQHGTIDEINHIAQQKFGENAYELFSKNGPEVTNRYVKGLSHEVGQQAHVDELQRLGVVRNTTGPKLKSVLDEEGKASVKEAQQQSPTMLRAAAGHFGAAAQGTRAEADEWVAGSERLAQHEAFDASGAVLSQHDINTSNSQDIARALHAEANKMDAQSQMLGHTADDVRVRQAMHYRGYKEATGKMIEKGWSDLGAERGAWAGKQMPDYVKSTFDKMDSLRKDPRAATSSMLKYYDKWIGLWKNYQLAMPGKAVRHQIGAVWNAWLGNVALDNASHAMSAWRAFQAGGLDAVDEADRSWVQKFVEAGLKHTSNFNEADLTGEGGTTWNPLSRNFKYFAKNREVQSGAQDYVRASMFYDSLQNGAHPLEAASKVRTMLGDPSNLTSFEKGVRRLVPFYAFMRTNIPVQLENMVTQPGKFMAYYHAQQNIERDVPTDKLMPQFYADTMAMRTPMTSGGNRVYLSPDLPFTRLGEYASGPKQLLAQVTPAIKLPVEMAMNEPAYTGVPFNPSAKNAPGTWAKIPGLMEALSHLGLASKVSGDQNTNLPQGGWAMTPKAEYLVESLLPPLGQARRAVPMGEPGMQDRQATTIAADLLGQNFRTLTPEQQAGELYARNAKMKALVEHLQNEGKLPSYIPGFHK